ncbi:MAG: response regulator [Thermodesulfobacteriota bacterium]
METFEIDRAKSSLKILIAEDDLISQKLTATILSKHGHKVTIVSNGRQALEAFDRELFDLILMDVQMPEMDGLEATRLIREKEKERGGRIPIIAMTAHVVAGDRSQCLEAGMDTYAYKPINQSEFLNMIERLVRTADNNQV